jgi:hypothetical protein
VGNGFQNQSAIHGQEPLGEFLHRLGRDRSVSGDVAPQVAWVANERLVFIEQIRFAPKAADSLQVPPFLGENLAFGALHFRAGDPVVPDLSQHSIDLGE